MKLFILLFSFLGLITEFNICWAKKNIIWVTPDWEPFHIVSGDNIGQGFNDSRLKFFQQKLTDYQHSNIVMNFALGLTPRATAGTSPVVQ